MFKNVNKVSLHVSANQISTKHSPTAVVWWGVTEWGLQLILTEIRLLVEELVTFLSISGPQKLWNLTATFVDWIKVSQYQLECNERGLYCVFMKHAQNFHSYCENNSIWKSVAGLQKMFSLSGTIKSNGQNFLSNMCMKHTLQAHSVKSLWAGFRPRAFWRSLVQSAPNMNLFCVNIITFYFLVLNIFCGVNFFLGTAVPRSCGFCRPDLWCYMYMWAWMHAH